MTKVGLLCDTCIYRHKELKDGWDVVCDVFPDGIPYDVVKIGDVDSCKKNSPDGRFYTEKEYV